MTYDTLLMTYDTCMVVMRVKRIAVTKLKMNQMRKMMNQMRKMMQRLKIKQVRKMMQSTFPIPLVILTEMKQTLQLTNQLSQPAPVMTIVILMSTVLMPLSPLIMMKIFIFLRGLIRVEDQNLMIVLNSFIRIWRLG